MKNRAFAIFAVLAFLAVCGLVVEDGIATGTAYANPVRGGVEKKGQVIHLTDGNAGCVTTDFAAMGGANATCRETAAFTVRNALLGDSCLASSVTYDGGLPTDAVLTCNIITTATAKAKVCLIVTDAGVLDLPSAEYCARIIR